jgi:peptidoglycan/xylan/chitin deacetylase (PgdA/CDA1 family)
MQYGCIVLCYHRVGELTTDYWQNVVSVENFLEHLRVIKNFYRPVSMNELIETFKVRKLPDRRTVVITFDDGYSSNLKYACESLSNKNLPAIFYLNTYSLNKKNFWWDELQKLIIDNLYQSDSIKLSIFAHDVSLPIKTIGQKNACLSILHKIMKGMDPSTRESLLVELGNQDNNQISNALSLERKPLSSHEIKSLSQTSLFEIGGHGHCHRALSLLKHNEQKNEILENRRILQEITQKPILHFSYPFGGKDDFDEISVKIVKECSFESAVTTSREPLRLGGDLYSIPRISIKNWDGEKFKEKLDQIWAM